MLIFAHRGASHDFPENTLAAFDGAIAQQADGIELDIFEHVDEFWVIHDRWLTRTTDGRGQLFDHETLHLAKLDAGNGEPIPTLWQALSTIRGRCRVNVEIKHCRHLDTLMSILKKAERDLEFQRSDWLVSSFNHHYLADFRALDNSFSIGALTATHALDYAAFAERLDATSIHVDLDVIDPSLIEDAHRRGLNVYVFTADEEADLIRLQQWGVDGVFTNRPAAARTILER